MNNIEGKSDKLEEAIIRVVAFFDLFNYPLTLYELKNYLDIDVGLKELEDFLIGINLIEERDGFYFLSGREEIIAIRQSRYNYTNRKIKIAKRFTRFFRLLPFIKMIAISNSIGAHNLREGSDIDFFIITSPKRIWLSRLFCAGLAKMLHSRPTVNNKKDKICLSFYVTENHLNLSDLKLPSQDPYFDYWIKSLILLYNRDKMYEKFLEANCNNIDNKNGSSGKSILENLAKKLQLRIMSSELKKEMNCSDGVVVDNDILKLYLHDRRREFLEKYNNKIHEIIKTEH